MKSLRKPKLVPTAEHASTKLDFGKPLDLSQWAGLQSELAQDGDRSESVQACFGDAARGGDIYLWGLACAAQEEASDLHRTLASLACHASGRGGDAAEQNDREFTAADREFLHDAADLFVGRVYRDDMSLVEAAEAILWAAAMPSLSRILPHEVWWQCGEQLLQLRADACLRSDTTSALHLLLVGELGLTLAWRLSLLSSCQKLAASSIHAVATFLGGEAESIDNSLIEPAAIRLVVAALIRCEKIVPLLSEQKSMSLGERDYEIAAEFATWMAALTRPDGTQVFSKASPGQCEVDYGEPSSRQTLKEISKEKKKRKRSDRSGDESQPNLHGLMQAAARFDPESLAPALAAALGQTHSGGRLAWEVSLPEAMWHSERGKCFAMLAEWDVRRGRTFVHYCQEDIQLEIMGGRHSLIQGTHQTMISVNGVDQQPTGGWQCTCEYSDDDVHLIELEQQYSGGVTLQRQWMLVRDDRCLLISDAVLTSGKPDPAPGSEAVESPRPEIQCISRLPLADDVEVIQDTETRELILMAGKKPRALVMPLAGSEWRVGVTACVASVSEDRHLVVTTRGSGAVYSPLWLDFQTRRFKRKRTWRQLTIAENLAIVPRHCAAAFRVQVGSEHWVVYRSMSGHDSDAMSPRSVMGRHLIADFFAARFHPGDGGMEELVSVDVPSEPDPKENQ